jgi:hypothetical protein
MGGSPRARRHLWCRSNAGVASIDYMIANQRAAAMVTRFIKDLRRLGVLPPSPACAVPLAKFDLAPRLAA